MSHSSETAPLDVFAVFHWESHLRNQKVVGYEVAYYIEKSEVFSHLGNPISRILAGLFIPTRSRFPRLKQFCMSILIHMIERIQIIHKIWTIKIFVVIVLSCRQSYYTSNYSFFSDLHTINLLWHFSANAEKRRQGKILPAADTFRITAPEALTFPLAEMLCQTPRPLLHQQSILQA